MNTQDYVLNYITELTELLKQYDIKNMTDILDVFMDAKKYGKRIFVFGNGGSSAHANHFACDLGKNATAKEQGRFQIVSICENIATIAAYANDIGYESVFTEQLKNYRLTKEDIIFAISSSGNSPNIISACQYAKGKGCKILSLTGFTGGKLKEISDISLYVNCNTYEKVEDLHMAALHILVYFFKSNLEYC